MWVYVVLHVYVYVYEGDKHTFHELIAHESAMLHNAKYTVN